MVFEFFASLFNEGIFAIKYCNLKKLKERIHTVNNCVYWNKKQTVSELSLRIVQLTYYTNGNL